MEIKFIPKIKQKDLHNNSPVFNNAYYRKWLTSDFERNPDNSRVHKTCRNLTSEFKKRFNKQSTTFRSEFTHYVYSFNYGKHTFNIYTGKKGTSIEVSNIGLKTLTNSEDFGKTAIEFLTKLWKEIGIEL